MTFEQWDEITRAEAADIEADIRSRHQPKLHMGEPCPVHVCCTCGGRGCEVGAVLGLLNRERAELTASQEREAAALARAEALEQRVAEYERQEVLADTIIKANADDIADLEDERDRYRHRAEAAEAALRTMTDAAERAVTHLLQTDAAGHQQSNEADILSIATRLDVAVLNARAILAAQQPVGGALGGSGEG